MKNFPVNINDKEYWISRSAAVAGFIFTEDNGLRVLAVKRSENCPDEVGKWCCPCGYVDYDETVEEACSREIKEETNLTVSPNLLTFSHIDSTPQGKQNIIISYCSYSVNYAEQTIYPNDNESEDVEWISGFFKNQKQNMHCLQDNHL